MLFDLRGRRKRVIQAIYVFLALLMGGGLVLFGIGGDANGGLFDALGISGSGSNKGGADFEKRAERLEKRARLHPKEARLQLEVARARYLAGNAAADRDENNQVTGYTEDSQAQFDKAAIAWERYLKLTDKPSPNVAIFMATAYAVLNDAKGAADAQKIVAEDRPSPTTLFELARYSYFAGRTEAGDKARDRAAALAEAQQKGAGKQLRKQLNEARKQAKSYLKAQKQQEQTGAPKQNPFDNPLSGGGLGEGSPAAP